MLALGTLLAFLSTAVAFKRSHTRPYELLIYRNLRTDTCTFTSLQDTQIHKRLGSEQLVLEEATYTERGELAPEGEGHWQRLRYLSDDLELLSLRALSHCGHGPSHLDQPGVKFAKPNVHAASGQNILTSESKRRDDTPPLEVHSLIQSGPSSNRVDLTFFSDGYTEDERDKFLEDAMRLALDVSSNQTFNTVKPLLNFWAAFVPSNETGIGVGGKPKHTPFGLYRDGTELRGVYYSYPDKARLACSSLGDRCDYPILLGNDPFYGGLGGEFTVITPSLANGPLVLRHELGHSIIDVGEEYDGGFAYFGVNAMENVSTPISWAHWLTTTSNPSSSSVPRVERSVMPLQEYAWTILNASMPWSTRFISSGTYTWHLVRFSISGIPTADGLHVELDGKDLGWAPRKDIGVDRWHYDVRIDQPLSGGEHEVSFTLADGDLASPQLCNVEILEFGDSSEFNRTSGVYGVFPTFSIDNTTTYRPTNEDCLMRMVTTANFCSVCLEGLWLSLLERVDLIDGLAAGCATNAAGKPTRTLEASLVPLAHLRDDDVGKEEAYIIKWLKNGVELEGFQNQTHIEVGNEEGTFEVVVQFETEEVRLDKAGYLSSHAAVTVTGQCATSSSARAPVGMSGWLLYLLPAIAASLAV